MHRILLLLVIVLFQGGCQSVDSASLTQRMAPCGGMPNCYRSGAERPPWTLADPTTAGWAAFVDQLRQRKRWTVVTEAENYVHFRVRTPLLRFADDVEFRLNPPSGTISYRSASRLGFSDLGTNRQRLRALAVELEATGVLRSAGPTVEPPVDE